MSEVVAGVEGSTLKVTMTFLSRGVVGAKRGPVAERPERKTTRWQLPRGPGVGASRGRAPGSGRALRLNLVC